MIKKQPGGVVSLLRFWVVYLVRRRVVSLLRPGGGLFAPVSGGHFDRFFQLWPFAIIMNTGILSIFRRLLLMDFLSQREAVSLRIC